MLKQNYPEIILLEAPSSVLYSSSAEAHPQTGESQTVLEAARTQAIAFGAFDVFLNTNGHQSDAAHRHNSDVAANGGEVVHSVIARFLPGHEYPLLHYMAYTGIRGELSLPKPTSTDAALYQAYMDLPLPDGETQQNSQG